MASRGIKMLKNMRTEFESDLREKLGKSVSFVDEKRFTTILIDKDDILEVSSKLKASGFDHLSDVTGIDYIDDGEFELIYHLWSHTEKRRLILKTRLPRGEPFVSSLKSVWSSAHMHERECKEMFGISFEGNNDLEPLLLEGWDEVPPLRKDFNSQEYVLEKFYGGERE